MYVRFIYMHTSTLVGKLSTTATHSNSMHASSVIPHMYSVSVYTHYGHQRVNSCINCVITQIALCVCLHSVFLSLSSELGSGEFGVVRRGVWSVGGEEREVAVKSLADGSTEEKRIQFLQEAAIMGQFKHPSIISLHGVLLDQEPVCNIWCSDQCIIDSYLYLSS